MQRGDDLFYSVIWKLVFVGLPVFIMLRLFVL
jgi:hypothetical protein